MRMVQGFCFQTFTDDRSIDPNAVPTAQLMAGFADRNASLLRRIGLPLGDPAAWIRLPDESTIAIVRDLEMDRVRDRRSVDRVYCPADFSPQDDTLHADRETAVAQSVAECLRRSGVAAICVDRTLPASFLAQLAAAAMTVWYDDQLGVTDRRCKSPAEQRALRQAQAVTEQVMQIICSRIARAEAGTDGVLSYDGETLTSERLRKLASMLFLERGFSMSHGAIVAGPPEAGDCHHSGTGPLHTGTPVIVDLFPRDEQTRFHGDCTRTVVHGTATDEVIQMHAAVLAAKAAAEGELIVGRTAHQVHRAATDCLIRRGYVESRGRITDSPTIQHGTGHGVGLEVHEPILLDDDGGPLLAGEVFTVEPGLYGRHSGGVRIEDMLVVGQVQPTNLNRLPTGLDWTNVPPLEIPSSE